GQRTELRQELYAPLPNQGAKLAGVVGKETEGAGGREFLALKEHGRPRRKQQERRDGAEAARTGERMKAIAAARVRNLIVVLNVRHEALRRDSPNRRAPALVLPAVPLPLKEVTMLCGRNQLLRLAKIVGVIRLVAPCDRDPRGVMKIVVPKSVEIVSAL